MEAGKRIKELRKRLGLSQREFAEKIGRTLSAIQKWEMGEREPSEMALKQISQTFGVSLEWLKTGEGEMFLEKKSNSAIEEIKKAVEQLEGKIPRFLQRALDSGDTDEILQAIADFLYDLAGEIKKGNITAETIKGNIAIGNNINQKASIKEEKNER